VDNFLGSAFTYGNYISVRCAYVRDKKGEILFDFFEVVHTFYYVWIFPARPPQETGFLHKLSTVWETFN
jgi:hypothetical protein